MIYWAMLLVGLAIMAMPVLVQMWLLGPRFTALLLLLMAMIAGAIALMVSGYRIVERLRWWSFERYLKRRNK